MKNADAFSSVVEWITLYLLDESRSIVWQKIESGSAEVYTDSTIDDAPSLAFIRASFTATITEFTTSRLVIGNNPRLTVTNNETRNIVFSISLKDYALLLKNATVEYSKYGDQEFLDCQDEWDMVFFLDEGDLCMDSYIYINSWKIVLHSASL